MSKSWESLRKRMSDLLEPYGAVSEFCRKTGLGRTSVDSWMEGKNIPLISQLDKIADGLGLDPWDAVKPLNEPIPQKDPLIESLSDSSVRDIVIAVIRLDKEQRRSVLDLINSFTRGARKHVSRTTRKTGN